MGRVLGVWPSGYYAWPSRLESARTRASRALLDAIRMVHAKNGGACGAPRVHGALRALGRRVGRHQVARPTRRAGLRGPAALPAARVLHRQLPWMPDRARPARAWLRGRPAQPGLARRPDLRPHGRGPAPPRGRPRASHAREIVGWPMRGTARTARIAIEALDMAIRRQRPTPGLICHPDGGYAGAGSTRRPEPRSGLVRQADGGRSARAARPPLGSTGVSFPGPVGRPWQPPVAMASAERVT